jgi:hypothetical protein
VRVPEPPSAGSAPASRRAAFGVRLPALGVAAWLALAGLAGCAKISAALGQQWIEVQFNPNTTIATARHVTRACSHVPNITLVPVKAVSTDPGMAQTARFNATKASDANMSELQSCLQRFSSVQGFNLIQSGDS